VCVRLRLSNLLTTQEAVMNEYDILSNEICKIISSAFVLANVLNLFANEVKMLQTINFT
jgi:hypothetical protein